MKLNNERGMGQQPASLPLVGKHLNFQQGKLGETMDLDTKHPQFRRPVTREGMCKKLPLSAREQEKLRFSMAISNKLTKSPSPELSLGVFASIKQQ